MKKGCLQRSKPCCLANRELASRRLPMHLKLTVAGKFVTAAEQLEFDQRLENPEVCRAVEYASVLFPVNARNGCCVKPTCFFFPRGTSVKTSR